MRVDWCVSSWFRIKNTHSLTHPHWCVHGGGVITNTVQDRGARCQSSVVLPLPDGDGGVTDRATREPVAAAASVLAGSHRQQRAARPVRRVERSRYPRDLARVGWRGARCREGRCKKPIPVVRPTPPHRAACDERPRLADSFFFAPGSVRRAGHPPGRSTSGSRSEDEFFFALCILQIC